MLKQGYDHFEVTHLEPKVDVCEKQYVFDAESPGQFSPAERCPAYKVPEHIAAAVHHKQRRDDIQTVEGIRRGTPTVSVTRGIDGGMNPIFLAAVKSHGGPGATIRTASGTIPPHVSPPAEPAQTTSSSLTSLSSTESRPSRAARPSVHLASAGNSASIGSLVGNAVGSKSEDQVPATRNAPSKPEPANTKTAIDVVPKPPRVASSRQSSAEPKSAPATAMTPWLSGAAPTVPAGMFDNRFGSWR